MSSAALELAEEERSPEREALAEAIESYNVDKAAIAAVESAIDFAKGEIRSARAAVEEAEAALEACKSERAQNLVSRAKGESRTVAKTSREARAELQVAQDELEAAIEAEAALHVQLKQARRNLSFSEPGLRNRVHEVIKTDPATHAYLKLFAQVEREYSTMLAFINGLPLFHPENLSALLGDRRFNADEAQAPWRDWEQRLREDPDATCHV